MQEEDNAYLWLPDVARFSSSRLLLSACWRTVSVPALSVWGCSRRPDSGTKWRRFLVRDQSDNTFHLFRNTTERCLRKLQSLHLHISAEFVWSIIAGHLTGLVEASYHAYVTWSEGEEAIFSRVLLEGNFYWFVSESFIDGQFYLWANYRVQKQFDSNYLFTCPSVSKRMPKILIHLLFIIHLHVRLFYTLD